MTHDIWTLVRAERCALVDDPDRLSSQGWQLPSLAERVTVVADDIDLRLGDGPELHGPGRALVPVAW